MTCHKMPRLPRNLHLVTTSRSADNAIRKKHATRHVQNAAPVTKNGIGGVQSAAPATKNATHLLKTWQKYCACHTTRLLTRRETCWNVTRSATPATQNDMTTSSDHQKSHVVVTFPIGTATSRPRRPRRPQTDGCERLRTVADVCGRLRTQEAGSREHGSTPRPPNVKREPFATHLGEKNHSTAISFLG